MPLQKVRSDGVFERFDGIHAGDVVNVSHSVAPYVRTHATTCTGVVAQNVDEGISVSNESLISDLWTAQLVCQLAGVFRYELKETYADESVQVLEFEVIVEDI